MTAVHPDLAEVVRRVRIEGPSRFTVDGAPRDLAEAGVAPAVAGPPGEPPLLPYLSSELYRLYTRSPAAPPPPLDIVLRRDFAAVLSAANEGCGTWEEGWTLASTAAAADGRVAVERDGIVYAAPPGEVRVREYPPRAGSACRVWVGKELRQLVPGFYMALGDATPDGDRGPTVRLYWHLTAEGAAPYLRAVTGALNRAGVPFRTKVVGDPRGYTRADAGVLYLSRADLLAHAETLRTAHRAVSPSLRDHPPLFTLRLGRGWGLAEDPATGESFGQARSAALGRALWSLHAGEGAGLDGALRHEGVDPARPYLRVAGADPYAGLAGDR